MIDFDRLVNTAVAATFGEAVIYIADQRPPLPGVIGVFDASYLPVLPLGDVGNEIGMPAEITERRPMLGLRLAQLPVMPEQGDRLEIRGLLYVIREVQDDGKGWAKLLLNISE